MIHPPESSMAQPSSSPSVVSFGGFRAWVDDPTTIPAPAPYFLAVVLVATVFVLFQGQKSASNLPHLNPRKLLEFTDTRPKTNFLAGSRPMLTAWYRDHPDKAARVIGDSGEITVLPPHMTNEIRNDPRLSFSRWVYKTFHAHLPGFEGFREGSRESHIVQDVIMKDLTKYLNKVTEPLAEETALVVEELCPASNNQAWHTVPLRETALRLVARVSSRVFLGEELCRNEDWLRVTRDYTVDAFKAADELRLWPAPLRFFVHWFLPSCARARADVREARQILSGVLEKRRAQKKRGEKVEFEDAIEWFEREAKGRDYDPVVVQLTLSFAAIHTTTDLITQVMTDLSRNPEIMGDLRQEIVKAISDGGWKKTSLYNMKLLDSVIKESLRMKPTGIVSMRRIASENIRLSDGTFVPKNGGLAVSAQRMWDPKTYDNPDKWDGRRFLRMRETPGQENTAQLVSTGPEHLGFGHGQHACPGRFFASNEAKVVLIHLLLKYDWRMPEGAPVPQIRHYAFSVSADPTVKLEYRRRTPEIEI
ncbi:cytochrome P450 [Chaetomium sp. MPI-CAGE-AT-0009]|nr:cytochrome P450 [Chaetomium sp. MPI-CAGE-AT-0009]